VIKIAMRKSSAAAKKTLPPLSRKKRSVVKEDEQLYLVRRSANASTNGFRHHRPRDKRRDEVAVEQFDPAKAILDFSDNERGAINKLLSANAYFRTHAWPTHFPFEWVDLGNTEMEYSSVLTRVSREYDRRF